MPSDQLFLILPFRQARKTFLVGAIRAKWGTMQAYANHLGIANGTLSQIVAGKGRSARIEAALAELTGYPAHVLFPPREKAA